MATTPSTLVVFSEDHINFPPKVAMLVMKQLFQYGVKNMVSKGDKIFITLHYTPRTLTLKKKFGNLPVRYMRTKIDSEEDFKILENVVKKYKFNLLDDDLDQVPLKSSSSGVVGTKRKYYLEAATRPEEEEEDDEDSEFAITQLLNIPKRQRTDTKIDDDNDV